MTRAWQAHRNPLVTAVIPVYNGEAYVRTAVESVLAQTYAPVECIVVDDGSTDGTQQVCTGLGDAVRYIRKSNGGVSSARNAGVAEAQGQFVAFLDADDTWLPEKLQKQMVMIRERPGTGMVYSGVYVVDENLQTIDRIDPAPPAVALRNTLLLEQPSATGIGSTGLLPASVIRSVGGFDERLSTSADCDLTCRVAHQYALACNPEPLARYRRHGSQMSANLQAVEHDMLLIFDKLFGDERLPGDVLALRRRAYANLYFMLAAGYNHRSDRGRALRYLLLAVAQHPARVGSLLWRTTSARAVRRAPAVYGS